MPKLTMLSAPSASGKSTLAWEMMQADGNAVRINRDDLRKMSITKWKPSREDWIIKSEIALCKVAAACKKSIIIDDTNLMPSDESRWKNVALEIGYTFEKVQLSVSLEECVRRDAERVASIGRPALERQFLKAGLWEIPVCVHCLGDKYVGINKQFLCETCGGTGRRKTTIWDIDGTVADLTHRVPWITIGGPCPSTMHLHTVGPFAHNECEWCHGTRVLDRKYHDKFYSLCHADKPIEIVIKWLQECFKEYHCVFVSGRSPEKGGEQTIEWLGLQNAPFHHILMRRTGCHGPDDEEKQLILNMILQFIPKEEIAFVVDDRPSVVAMWRRNGLRVIPVRGRDDAAFYAQMDELEATHPRPDLEEAASECVPVPTGDGGGDSVRTAESEGELPAPGVCC